MGGGSLSNHAVAAAGVHGIGVWRSSGRSWVEKLVVDKWDVLPTTLSPIATPQRGALPGVEKTPYGRFWIV